jgi:hypothetical protein
MVAGVGKALGQSLARGLAKGVGKATSAQTKAAARAVGRTKGFENVRQGGIIEAQKAKEKSAKKQGFKKALKEAKAKKQKTFTFDGHRFSVANYA